MTLWESKNSSRGTQIDQFINIMTSRRDFIRATTASLVAMAAYQGASAFTENKIRTKGVLLGTIEKQMKEYPDGTLHYLSRLGYQTLEYPGTFGHDAKTLRKIIESHNLVSLAGGESMWYIKQNIASMLSEFEKIQKKYLICYWPWTDDGKNKSIDDWKRNADVFNQLGRVCKAAGVHLAYHNHDIEFLQTENEIPYDTLLKYTDPDLVTFQIDLWWVVKGGRNPMEYLQNYAGRFKLCHIKTFDVIHKTQVAVDYPLLFSKANNAGIQHFIIENEKEIVAPFDYLKQSITYLNDTLKG